MSVTTTRSPWVYLLPAIHFCACSIIMLGYVVPAWRSLLLGWEYVIVVDFPVSFIAVGLAWSHQVLSLIWFLIAGTVWWYVLGRVVDAVLNRFRRRAQA
jgi:hypothetical protein